MENSPFDDSIFSDFGSNQNLPPINSTLFQQKATTNNGNFSNSSNSSSNLHSIHMMLNIPSQHQHQHQHQHHHQNSPVSSDLIYQHSEVSNCGSIGETGHHHAHQHQHQQSHGHELSSLFDSDNELKIKQEDNNDILHGSHNIDNTTIDSPTDSTSSGSNNHKKNDKSKKSDNGLKKKKTRYVLFNNRNFKNTILC